MLRALTHSYKLSITASGCDKAPFMLVVDANPREQQGDPTN